MFLSHLTPSRTCCNTMFWAAFLKETKVPSTHASVVWTQVRHSAERRRTRARENHSKKVGAGGPSRRGATVRTTEPQASLCLKLVAHAPDSRYTRYLPMSRESSDYVN